MSSRTSSEWKEESDALTDSGSSDDDDWVSMGKKDSGKLPAKRPTATTRRESKRGTKKSEEEPLDDNDDDDESAFTAEEEVISSSEEEQTPTGLRKSKKKRQPPKHTASRGPPKKKQAKKVDTISSNKKKKSHADNDETKAKQKNGGGGGGLRKKQFTGLLTVGLTGAREGDVLHGCAKDTQNVVLRVDSGTIAAPASIRNKVEEEVGRDQVVKLVAQHFRLSVSAAEMRYRDCPVESKLPNHQPLGQSCKHDFRWSSSSGGGCDCPPAACFTILNQGVWQSFAEEHGNGELLKNMVREGQSVCYRDILKLMHTPGKPGGKTLILRPKLFQIALGPVALSDDDPRLQDADIIDAAEFVNAGSNEKDEVAASVYEMDNRLFRLPVSAACAPAKNEVCGLVIESLQGLLPTHVLLPEKVQKCVDTLSSLTVGGLKSMLQKSIRFHAVAVDMSIGQNAEASQEHFQLPVGLVAATTAGLLFTESGQFSPELQLYTRGSTSALKRVAIILVEDAWVEGAEKCVLGLMAMALATQRMPEYEPPRNAVIETMRLAAKAAESPFLIAWRKSVDRTNTTRVIQVDKQGIQALQHASELLKIVRSFQGDMDMMESVAKSASCTRRLKLTEASTKNRLPLMNLCHCIDQHTYRGIGHIGPEMGKTFAERFRLIFRTTTGFNPRQESSAGFEERREVQMTRFAQLCIARFAFKVSRSAIPKVPSSENIETRLALDSGTLAAAVGPIPLKIKGDNGRFRDVLVMLGVRCPEDEIVMLKPAREKRDLFGSLSSEQRVLAVSQAREKQFNVRSPVFKGTRVVSFEDGCWRLDGEPWDHVLKAGCIVTVPLIESPEWVKRDDLSAVLLCDEALNDALSTTCDTGLISGAEQVIKRLMASCTVPVGLRAVSILRQQYSKVSLPTPALDGRLGSDQLAAYSGDWDVFRLLALISRLAPGALKPTMPPNFSVVDANLLRIVEQWMIHAMRGEGENVGSQTTSNQWTDHPLWSGMAEAEQHLMEHQRCAVASMHRRDHEADTGHFLIMDTGTGKTVTSLCYFYRWLVNNGRTETKRILWVTPAGTVTNLVNQLRGKWNAPVFNVPRLSKAKKVKAGDTNRLVLKDYHVNVIHADHLRDMIDAGLAEKAPSSVIVFDEVDEMYAPTLRTSAARRLAQLCPKFVAQTATPMRKNESQLLAWLSDTCSFPVDSNNLLVAASGMVSIQLEIGIASKDELILVPMVDEVRTKLRALFAQRRWLPMAQLVQKHTDAAMVHKAVESAILDRKTYPNGGVLLVADTKDHADTLIVQCNKVGRGAVRAGGFDTLDAPDAAEFGVVIVPKSKDRGYNSACRLGSMVSGVYAGNGASRHQMRGRLRRLGQPRKSVTFTTVVMENSLLHLLHIRHDAVDSMNITLQQLGETFASDIMQALDDAS